MLFLQGGDGFTVGKSAGEIEGTHEELLSEAELAAAAEEKETHSFQIDPAQVGLMGTTNLSILNF